MPISGGFERNDEGERAATAKGHLAMRAARAPMENPCLSRSRKGMLIYTRDGHMSVQVMYPESANTLYLPCQ